MLSFRIGLIDHTCIKIVLMGGECCYDKFSEDFNYKDLSWGVSRMQGWRKRLEDYHSCYYGSNHNQPSVFAVFDGHGGTEVAQFLHRNFIKELLTNNSFKNGHIKQALQENFFRMDDLLNSMEGLLELQMISKYHNTYKKRDNQANEKDIHQILGLPPNSEETIHLFTGSTACVAVLQKGELYVANAGESKAILCQNGKAIPLTTEHYGTRNKEAERVNHSGGFISEGRVKGNLLITRAIGDLEYKSDLGLKREDYMVTCNPDISHHILNNQSEFLIIASDGVWECMSDQELCDFFRPSLTVKKHCNSSKIEELFDKIIAKEIYNETGLGSDNMCCIVIDLSKLH